MKTTIKILFCILILISVTGCNNETSTKITYSSKTEKYLNETGIGKTYVVTKYDNNISTQYWDVGFMALYYEHEGISYADISNNDGDFTLNLTNKTGKLIYTNESKLTKELENRAKPVVADCSSYPEPTSTGTEEIEGMVYGFEKFVRDQQEQPEAGSEVYYFDSNGEPAYFNLYWGTKMSNIVQIIDYGTEFDNNVFEIPDDIVLIG
jgi:hypothetical protein